MVDNSNWLACWKAHHAVIDKLNIRDILCIPCFIYNLLSASQLTDARNCATIVFPIFYIFQDTTMKQFIGIGELKYELF